MLRLSTFAISHFSEKARWTLDFEQIPYVERRLLPGPHLLVTRRLASGTSVPVLEHDGTVVQGSSAILDYAETKLGGTRLRVADRDRDAAAQLEALADHAFGLGTQRIFYEKLLDDPDTVVAMWAQDQPWWVRGPYRAAFQLIAGRIRAMYDITPPTVAAARDAFARAFDETDRVLSGRRYFFGDDRPTRADVAIASLLAPLCMPPEHVLRWPPITPTFAELQAPFRGRHTWTHVLRMYREHRVAAQ